MKRTVSIINGIIVQCIMDHHKAAVLINFKDTLQVRSQALDSYSSPDSICGTSERRVFSAIQRNGDKIPAL